MSHNPDATVGENGGGLGESPEKEAVLVMFLPLFRSVELQFNRAGCARATVLLRSGRGDPLTALSSGHHLPRRRVSDPFTGTCCRSRWGESRRTAQDDDGKVTLRFSWVVENTRASVPTLTCIFETLLSSVLRGSELFGPSSGIQFGGVHSTYARARRAYVAHARQR